MPRRNASQMRMSASEKVALKVTRADLRERRRARLGYKANEKAVQVHGMEVSR